MDAEVQNAAEQRPAEQQPAEQQPAEQPAAEQPSSKQERAAHDDAQPGWRSWFRKNDGPAEAGDESGQDPGDGLVAPERSPRSGRPARRDTSASKPERSKRLTDSLITGPLVNPRLRNDPRLRVWLSRTALCLLVFIVITIVKDWRFGVTAAAIVACADTVFRSRITGITPSSARVTAAQRNTGRRLRVLRAAGYMALHARRIPGTESIIDHIVIGPSGVFTVDSQRMDTRLPVRAIGGMLFHGPKPQDQKIDHARYEAQQAAALIGAELGQRVRVRPAMVVYGPSIPWVVMRLKGVDVFDGGHVSTYFRRQSKATVGHHLDGAQVALVFAAAAHALPSLD